ncbi:MAG TPA: hypothetical protein VGM97_10050 [Steroidobacteraceae bacterium]|jgi:hypothetical protein
MGRKWRRDPAKERFWRRTLQEWRRSGLSVREFCDWQSLSEASLYAWRRELAKRDGEAVPRGAPPARNRSTARSPFVPVHVVADAASDSRASDLLELHLPTGVRLRVPSGFDRQTLTDVLNALGHGVEAPRC